MEKHLEVLSLRAKKLTPKQIAKNLGLKVSEVSEILKATAEQESLARKERGELAPIAQCYINSSSAEYLLKNDTSSSVIRRGLATVCVVRSSGYERYEVSTYLVDYWCLGLKDTIEVRKFNGNKYREFVEMLYANHDESYQEISLVEAQAIVWGAIEYAKKLGLEPHEDFEKTKGHLGEWDGELQLEFGRAGRPYYCQGPYDNTAKILKALRQSVGEGNFDYLLVVEGF